jgi:hypothetical protein
MATLTGRKPSATYRDLLQVSNANAGVDSTLRAIEDGEGTASALQISTTGVNATGALQRQGVDVVDDNRQVATSGSLAGGGDLGGDRTLTLDGDDEVPGADKYYGTDNAGAKGFHPLPLANGAVKASATDPSPAFLDTKVRRSIKVTAEKVQLEGDAEEPGELKYYGTDANGDRGWYSLIAPLVSYKELIFFGELTDEQIFGAWKPHTDDIEIIGAMLSAQDAPTGSAVTVDLVNGAGVEQGKIATLAAAAKYQETIFGAPLAVGAGALIQAKIKSVGSASPGAWLTLTLLYRVS